MKQLRLYLSFFAAALLVAMLVITGFFQPQELEVYDWLMRTRPKQQASSDIVIVEIADDTLKSLGRWPISRDYHALLIKALAAAGCRAIVFDVLMSEPAQHDEVLAQAMGEAGNVFLPYAFRIEEKRASGNVLVSEEILGGVAERLKAFIAGSGQINVFIDPDGKVRRLPLWVRFGDKRYPSLGFLAAGQKLKFTPEDAVLSAGSVRVKTISIPVDDQSSIWINYPGSWNTTFKRFSYVDVLKAHVARQKGEQPWFDLGVFKDKICFVGLTAAGTSDFRANPFDPVYPMVGAQASLCDSMLRGVFISRAQPGVRIAVALAVIAFALLICVHAAPLPAFLCCLLLACAYAGLVWVLFGFRGLFLDLFLPALSVAVVYTAVLARKFLEEAQKRRVLENELKIAAEIQRSFLPPDVRILSGISIRSFLKPAKYVGGDLFDYCTIGEGTVGFFIGDVAGKGVSASLIMAQAISLLRALARSSKDPAQVLQALNQQLTPLLKGRFVTAQYIIVHTKERFWEGACAGHPALLFLDKQAGSIEELNPASGPPLGLAEGIAYSTVKRGYAPGDKLLLYTDGWTETRNAGGEDFGLARLKEVFLSAAGKDPESLLQSLCVGQETFQARAQQHDDLTCLILQF